MIFNILISTEQMHLIQQLISATDVSKYTPQQQEELDNITECFDMIIEDGDAEALHDIAEY